MTALSFKIIKHSSPEYEAAVKLREGILRKPLGLTFLPEELEAEKNHIQIAGFQGAEVIGTAVLAPEGKDYKMQRVVVKQGMQDSGIGSKMMEFCEGYARNQNIRSIYCHARDSAVNFYLKNGYLAEGDYFDEDTIPHLKMRKVVMTTIKMGKYRHYKGHVYEVTGTARHCETFEDMVIYKALYGEFETWVRPLKMFLEDVEVNGKIQKRFEFVGDGSSKEIINKNITLQVSDDDQKSEVLKKLGDFNRAVLNIRNDQESSQPINYNLQDNGVIIGGIHANLYFLKSIMHVDHLFVDEKYRGQDFGSLLLAKVEEIAKERSATLAHLDTFDFQAKDFYLKHGYEVFGVLEDCPKGHKRYYMKEGIAMIRHAAIDDTPKLLPLLSELGYPATLEDLNRRFLKFVKNPGFGIAVYEMNGEITGFIAWTKTDHLISDATRFSIVGLVVSTSHRSTGIGKKLMKFVEDIAQQDSPAIIDLTSGLRRAQDGTHEFYKRIGYQNEGPMAKLYLRKEL